MSTETNETEKSLAGLPDKNVDILDSSSDEDNEDPTLQETKKKAQKENRTKNKLNRTQTATRHAKANDQNDAQIGTDKT